MQFLQSESFSKQIRLGLIELPKLPCNVRVEAIFIVLSQRREDKPLRRLHADIIGGTTFLDDVRSVL